MQKLTNIILTILFTIMISQAFGQVEICNNGIDDDGDGLIDLNDTEDCFCDSIITNNIPSLIPNPSFEAHSCCPEDYASLNCANTWIQASQATSDYFHTCGFVGAAPLPFPDGNAAAGVILSDNYSEYIGACLNSVMQAGQTYQIQFDLAFEVITDMGDYYPTFPVDLPPINFTIYGSTSCSNLPFSGTNCPVGFGNWQVLGTVSVNPEDIHGVWENFTISFTSPANIRAIVIGGPCAYPSGGAYSAGLSNPVGAQLMPYFFIDNLILNNSSYWGVPIIVTGEYCLNNLVLGVTTNIIETVQWYLDGVAISNEYYNSLAISQNGLPPGNYTAMISDLNNCATGSVLIIAPEIDILPIQDISSCNEVYLPTIIGTNLTGNQNYYTQPHGQGQIVTSPVTEAMYVYAYDAIGICFDQESFFVNPYNSPNVSDIPDKTACTSYNLPIITGSQLTGNQHYYTGPNGTGSIVISPILTSQLIYIYDGTSECSDEENFYVTIIDTPNILEIDDMIGCNYIDLPIITGIFLTGSQNYYSLPNGQGSIVPTHITHSQVVYAYDANSICSDNIPINIIVYNNLPSYAGADGYVCGTSTTLEATPSIPGSTGYWTGSGIIQNPNQISTNVTNGYGTYTYYWSESYDVCSGLDSVKVSFMISPAPIISINADTVCSSNYSLQVLNSEYPGFWTAYNATDNSLISPAPIYFPSINSPDVTVVVGNFNGPRLDVKLVWTEQNQIFDNICSTSVSAIISFAKQPVASIGVANEGEVCGLVYTGLNADLTGCQGALTAWVSPQIQCIFSNCTQPNSTISLYNDGVFGDSAHIRIPLIWTVNNSGCTDLDTMWVTFYQKPHANAGINGSICGFDYNLHAFYNLTETANYSPSGSWSIFTSPNEEYAVFNPFNEPNATVHVYETGIWQFAFRENNSLLTSCYDTDTVQVEFVEKPVISAGEDKDICGNLTTLNATSGGHSGTWIHTAGANFADFNNPNTNVEVTQSGHYAFIWLESNQASTSSLSCSSMDSVIISFWPQPSAHILTDENDRTACGLKFENLRAEQPGSGIRGYWYDTWPATMYGNVNSVNTWAQVYSYGCHDFFWIEESGPELNPGFCIDTAGPLNICFIKMPDANAGSDTIFCGLNATLNASPSIGTGVWSTPSIENVHFSDQNNPNCDISSLIYNSDPENVDHFTLIWTEDNGHGCTDNDIINVMFVEVPKSNLSIIPPKCFGETATIAAIDNNQPQYSWHFYNGLINQSQTNELGASFLNLVSWNNNDSIHRVSLIVTNQWGCMSPIKIDTIVEPPVPDFNFKVVADTCALDKGGIIIEQNEEISFFWMSETAGHIPGTAFNEVYNIPSGEYPVRFSYLTPNTENYAYYLSTFGTANCADTLNIDIPTVGMMNADFSVSAEILLTELVAPNANVIFVNNSDYDNVRKKCEWHFGDGTVLKSCDERIEHTYPSAGCYHPYLVIMNRDLPECNDTARLLECINVENASKIEVPNIFSPNGDGTNDFFQVKAQTLRSFKGTILNRWGNEVFSWTNWQEYEKGWDGNLQSGNKASSGVYFYIIEAIGFDNKEHNLHGIVHLMREE